MQYRFTNEHFPVYVWTLTVTWVVIDIIVIGLAVLRPSNEDAMLLMLFSASASIGIKYPLIKMLMLKSGRLDHYLYTWSGILILVPLVGAMFTLMTYFMISGDDGVSVFRGILFIVFLLASAPGIALLFATEKCIEIDSSSG